MTAKKPRVARTCIRCKKFKMSDLFEGTRNTCMACRSQEQIERIKRRRDDDTPRVCGKCGRTRPTYEFSKTTGCKECSAKYYHEYAKRRSATDPEYAETKRRYQRNWHLKKTYGISIEEYEALLKTQDGHCAICPATRGASDRESLCVDHNHITGASRALLCVRCNLSVRDLGDDLAHAEMVMAYVRKHAV
jgi:hypothetical protein